MLVRICVSLSVRVCAVRACVHARRRSRNTRSETSAARPFAWDSTRTTSTSTSDFAAAATQESALCGDKPATARMAEWGCAAGSSMAASGTSTRPIGLDRCESVTRSCGATHDCGTHRNLGVFHTGFGVSCSVSGATLRGAT